MQYKIVFKHNLVPEQVRIYHTDSTLPESDAIAKRDEEIWQAKIAEGHQLFNGKVYRVEQYKNDLDGGCSLTLSQAYYKNILGAGNSVVLDTDETLFPKGMCCALLISTTDGYFIFGQKGGNSRIVGGSYSPEEVLLTHGQDILKTPLQELYEELGVPSHVVVSNNLIAGYLTNVRNFCLLFRVVLGVSSQWVKGVFATRSDMEFDSLKLVKEVDLYNYVLKYHPDKIDMLLSTI